LSPNPLNWAKKIAEMSFSSIFGASFTKFQNAIGLGAVDYSQ